MLFSTDPLVSSQKHISQLLVSKQIDAVNSQGKADFLIH
jgi:hypothetical protein